MGQPKEALPVRGTTLLGHTVEQLLDCSFPVVVVARDPQQELPPLPLEAEYAYDAEPGGGPLVGLMAGLNEIGEQCDAVLLTSCDAPFVDGRVINWLADQLGDHDAVAAEIDDIVQPLPSLVRTRVLPRLAELVESGERGLRAALAAIDTRILAPQTVAAFDPEHYFLRNLNDVEAYRAARADLEGI